MLQEIDQNRLLFEVTISGRTREVCFTAFPGGTILFCGDEPVSIKIPDTWNNISNKLRRGKLWLQKIDGDFRILNEYTVLGKTARINGWLEDGRHPADQIARDYAHPSPEGWDRNYEERLWQGLPLQARDGRTSAFNRGSGTSANSYFRQHGMRSYTMEKSTLAMRCASNRRRRVLK